MTNTKVLTFITHGSLEHARKLFDKRSISNFTYVEQPCSLAVDPKDYDLIEVVLSTNQIDWRWAGE